MEGVDELPALFVSEGLVQRVSQFLKPKHSDISALGPLRNAVMRSLLDVSKTQNENSNNCLSQAGFDSTFIEHGEQNVRFVNENTVAIQIASDFFRICRDILYNTVTDIYYREKSQYSLSTIMLVATVLDTAAHFTWDEVGQVPLPIFSFCQQAFD